MEPICRVWDQFKSGSVHDAKVTTCLECLAGINQILGENPYALFLPLADSARMLSLTDTFLLEHTWLGNVATSQGRAIFNAVPKHHWMWHLAHRSKVLNPRRVACFIDEDFVKHMKVLAGSCVMVTQLHKVVASFFDKYLMGVTLEAPMV